MYITDIHKMTLLFSVLPVKNKQTKKKRHAVKQKKEFFFFFLDV